MAMLCCVLNLVLMLPFGHSIKAAAARQVGAHPALSATRMADPAAVARVLAEIVGVEPAGGAWLTDLRGFDAAERAELCDALRSERAPLADRSKLRRLITAAAELPAHEGLLKDATRSEQRKQLSLTIRDGAPRDLAPRRQLQSDGNGGSMGPWTPSPWSSPLSSASLRTSCKRGRRKPRAPHSTDSGASSPSARRPSRGRLTSSPGTMQQELSEFIFPMYTAGTNLMQAWCYEGPPVAPSGHGWSGEAPSACMNAATAGPPAVGDVYGPRSPLAGPAAPGVTFTEHASTSASLQLAVCVDFHRACFSSISTFRARVPWNNKESFMHVNCAVSIEPVFHTTGEGAALEVAREYMYGSRIIFVLSPQLVTEVIGSQN